MTRRSKVAKLPADLTRAFVVAAIKEAAEAGHDLELLSGVKVSANRTGYGTRCTCGWASTPKSKRIKAFTAAFMHIGESIGDARFENWEARRNAQGVSSEGGLADGITDQAGSTVEPSSVRLVDALVTMAT